MSVVGQPGTAEPECALTPGYSSAFCAEQGRLQNVNTTIKQALAALGYSEAQLLGKMDIGGGMGGGFHAAGPPPGVSDARGDGGARCDEQGGPNCYLPDCNVHSWARPANVSKAAFRPPMLWVDDARPVPAAHDDAIIASCLKYLASLPRAGAAPPPRVFLYCSIVSPHPPYWTNATWLQQVNQTALASFYDAAAVPVSSLSAFDLYQSRAEGISGTETREETLRLAAAYLGRVAMADAMMGQVLDALNASAAGSEAAVLFVADHGELALQHHMVEKMSHYEGSARVPFILAGPQVPAASRGTRSLAMVSLLDVFPTLVQLAGVADPAATMPFLSGRSVLPLLAGGDVPWRRFVTAQFHGEESNTGAFMVRRDDDDAQWKAIFFGTRTPGFEGYAPKLFNLTADPHEIHDLAQQRPDVVATLEAQLLSVYDYQAVDQAAKADQREAFVRWMAQWPGDGWKAKLPAAYTGFDASDLDKIEAWLNATSRA